MPTKKRAKAHKRKSITPADYLDLYQKVVADVTEQIRKEREAEQTKRIVDLNVKYAIGQRILQLKTELIETRQIIDVGGWVGSLGSLMQSLSDDLAYGRSELYNCLHFAMKFRSWDEFSGQEHQVRRRTGDSTHVETLKVLGRDLYWQEVKEQLFGSNNTNALTNTRISTAIPNSAYEQLGKVSGLGKDISFIVKSLIGQYLTTNVLGELVTEDWMQSLDKESEKAVVEWSNAVLSKCGKSELGMSNEEVAGYRDDPSFLNDYGEEIAKLKTPPFPDLSRKNLMPKSLSVVKENGGNRTRQSYLLWQIPSLESFDEKTRTALAFLTQRTNQESLFDVVKACALKVLNDRTAINQEILEEAKREGLDGSPSSST